jgi:hypothetical protein
MAPKRKITAIRWRHNEIDKEMELGSADDAILVWAWDLAKLQVGVIRGRKMA